MSAAALAARLPGPSLLRAWSIALAAADAVVCEDPRWRYFSFDRSCHGEGELASMTDGSGNDYWIAFRPAGVYIRGFDHESPLSPFARNPLGVFPGLIDEVPEQLRSVLDDPGCQEHGVPLVTVSLWRLTGHDRWQVGAAREVPAESLAGWADPDGSDALFAQLDGDPGGYLAFAQEYYERDIDRAAVEHLFAHRPLTREVVAGLAPGRDWTVVQRELSELGYPADQVGGGGGR